MLPKRRELSRDEAAEAIRDGIRALRAGHDPLRDQDLGERYWMAIHRYIAPRVIARGRLDYEVAIDEGEAVELVMERLDLQVEADHRRHQVNRENSAAIAEGKEKLKPLLLPAIVEAEDPIGYLIKVATKMPNPESPREADRYPGWLHDELLARRNVNNLHSVDDLDEPDAALPADQPGRFDEAGFAGVAAHILPLILRETPAELRTAVREMVEWSVAALPLIARKHERDLKRYRDLNRVVMAAEIFSESLTLAQMTALHNLVWGPMDDDGELSSLLGYVTRVRYAHSSGDHDRLNALGRPVRDAPLECTRCALTPMSGEVSRALVNTYADNMVRSLRTAA